MEARRSSPARALRASPTVDGAACSVIPRALRASPTVNGAARGRIPRSLFARAAALALLLALAIAPGCKKAAPNTPEGVADSFVEAYFRQMDQQRAKEFTALGATKMLETEMKEVQEVRKDGFDPGAVEIAVHRGEPVPRDERIRIPYELEITTESGKQVRDADVELSRIDGSWKVVRVGVKARDAAPAP